MSVIHLPPLMWPEAVEGYREVFCDPLFELAACRRLRVYLRNHQHMSHVYWHRQITAACSAREATAWAEVERRADQALPPL